MLERLEGLVSGRLSPAEVADWARPLVVDDSTRSDGWYDPPMWEALKLLLAADLLVTPDSFLYGPQDYEIWLTDFREATHL